MNKLRRLVYLILCTVGLLGLAAGCGPDESGATKNPQTLLVYMAGNSNLSSYAYMNCSDLMRGYVPNWCRPGEGDVLLVYMHTMDSLPRLLRLYKDNKKQVRQELIVEYPDHNSLDPAVLKQVLTQVAETFPAQENGLILWSHGTGWLPKGYYDNPGTYDPKPGQFSAYPSLSEDPCRDLVKSMGPDSGIEVDIQELEGALPIRYDYIIFDACLMGGVEVAYQLREKTDYVVASVAEILAQGFPYKSIAHPLMAGNEADLEQVATLFFEHYNSQPQSARAATIALVATEPLEQLAQAVRRVYENHRSELATFDRRRVQGFYRNQRAYFYDLDDFIRQLASEEEYAEFQAALAACVLYEAATESFLLDYSYGFYINRHCGLSTYIPAPWETYLLDFYQTLAWNESVQLIVAQEE